MILFAVSTGCATDKTIDATVLATAQESYDKALEEVEAGNSEAALELLNVALQPGGGLSPDIHVDARIQRAIVQARLNQFEGTHADLDVAAEGAADMAAVHVARAFAFAKEGKDKESKVEMSKAKKLKKGVKAIRD